MKITKSLLALALVAALVFTSVPWVFAETETPLSYTESFEGYNSGDLVYDYSNESNDQDFITYGGNGRKRLSAKWANLSITSDTDYVHSGSKAMYGTTYCQFATTVVDLSPNTEYKLSFWYAYKENATAATYLKELKYGFFTADTVNCESLTEISGLYKTDAIGSSFKAGEWAQATLNFTTGDDVSNMLFGYRYTDTNGLSGDDEVINKATLYVDDISITPVVSEYSYKKFYDFENYDSGDLLYDRELNSADQKFVTYSNSKTLLTSFGNLTVTSTADYVRSGTKAMYGSTYYQYATTKVELLPNTEYYAEFWYTYKRNSKYPTTHLKQITYGFYSTTDDALTLEGALSDKGSTVTDIVGSDLEPTEWRKASMFFTTGTDVDNVVFGYKYTDEDENGVENKATLYVDDLLIKSVGSEDMADITVNSKNTAVAIPIDGSFESVLKNTEIKFKVLTEPNLTPTVTVNGTVITPTDGIYTMTATENSVIDIDCGAADEGKPQQGKDREGNDLTKYNREIYMKPFGENNTVYHETVLFYTGRDTAKLLYPVSDVISLRSYDLTTAYIKGVDYEITEDGQIKRLEGSRIPEYTSPLVGGLNSSQSNKPFTTADGQYLQFIGDTVYPQYAVAVTYEYTEEWAENEGYNTYKVPSQANKIANTIEKLENGETVNIVIYGDSTSCGYSSSGLNYTNEIYDETNTEGNFKTNYVINVAPYAETWIDMLIGTLRERYPDATINLKNLSLGGKKSSWGKDNLAERLALLDWAPDLMILAFGGNDLIASTPTTPEQFGENTQGIIDVLHDESNVNANADADVLLWSPKINNPLCTKYAVENFLAYEEALADVAAANDNVGLARVTSHIAEIFESKEATDYLNTNVNHGNDFCARVIAQGILSAMTPQDYIPGDIDSSGEVDLNDVVTLAQYVAGWKGISYNEKALDTNASGEVDLSDVVLLAQYVAGWKDIILY